MRTLYWAVSSAVEHCLHTAGVTGSNPVPPTSINKRNPLRNQGVFAFWLSLLCAEIPVNHDSRVIKVRSLTATPPG
jgi:hypothetical protein